MAALKWKAPQFRVVRQPLTKEIFGAWIDSDGRPVFERALDGMRCRWFFGRSRAKRSLFNNAKLVTKPDAEFCRAVKKTLDELPILLRKIGILIKKREHRDLYSADATMALVVIPRAIAQQEFTVFLLENLAVVPGLVRYEGLARHILRAIGTEAEELFFQAMRKGEQYLHQTGQSIILGVDPEFGWRIKGVNGHYYCGYAGKNGQDLTKKKDLRKFKSEMEDVVTGQSIHLSRLKPADRVAVASALQTGGPKSTPSSLGNPAAEFEPVA
jgi:hypothetical protein